MPVVVEAVVVAHKVRAGPVAAGPVRQVEVLLITEQLIPVVGVVELTL
jgi:hypothetical protein